MPKKDVEAQFQEAVASTLRAMAGGTEHDVVFVGDNTFLHHDKIRLPKLNDIDFEYTNVYGDEIAFHEFRESSGLSECEVNISFI